MWDSDLSAVEGSVCCSAPLKLSAETRLFVQ